MRAVTICVALAFGACSVSNSTPPVAAASRPFDPYEETIEVPAGTCAQLAGWYCVSARGWAEMVKADIEQEREHKSEVAKLETARKVAEAQRAAALEALEHAQFWSRWGPLIVLGVGFVASGVGVAGGALIGKAK